MGRSFFAIFASVKIKRYIAAIVLVLAVGCTPETVVVRPEEEVEPQKPIEQPDTVSHDKTPEKLAGTEISKTTWKGLDLGEPHVITRIDYSRQGCAKLGLFEGANNKDFSDALPLGIIKTIGSESTLTLEVNCSKGFRYVRYIAPGGSSCSLASLELYGEKGQGDNTHLCQLTNLPTVVINTQNAKEIKSKTEYVKSNLYIISNDGTRILETTETGVRGRGNASWDFPKKPYRIKFAEKHKVLDAPSENKDWTLINNYGDKTLMRNILAFEVSRRVGMAYTPFCAPVDVILNGDYKGCYQLCDQIEVAKGRVDAKDGYLIEIDAYAYGEDVYFYSNRGIPVTVKYPKEDVITSEQLSFITNFFNKFESASDYSKYLDIDSFLRNFIVGEFCGNTDTYWSVNMYKDGANGVLYTGPIWDYDLSFENDGRTAPINNLWGYIYATKGSVAADEVRRIVTKIVKSNASSKARLVEIWDDVKPSLMDLNDYVDSTAALLDESQQLNFMRWPILNTIVHQNPQASGSYAGEVQVVKDYITGRLTKFNQLVHQ